MKRLLLGLLLIGIAPHADAQGMWFYCGSTKAYYPYVQTCPETWREVTPFAQRSTPPPQGTQPSVPSGPIRPPAADARQSPSIAENKGGGAANPERGWLGLRIQGVTPEIAESLGLETASGALVVSITPNSAADRAGIKAGDVIEFYAGYPIGNMHDLPRVVAGTTPGTSVQIVLWRGGRQMIVAPTIDPQPALPPQLAQTGSDRPHHENLCLAPPYGGTEEEFTRFVKYFGSVVTPSRILGSICNEKYNGSDRSSLYNLGFTDDRINSEDTESLAVEAIVAMKSLADKIP